MSTTDDDIKPTIRDGLEYNFKPGVTTSTPDYPSRTQYPYLGSTYLITEGVQHPTHSRMKEVRTLLTDNFFLDLREGESERGEKVHWRRVRSRENGRRYLPSSDSGSGLRLFYDCSTKNMSVILVLGLCEQGKYLIGRSP